MHLPHVHSRNRDGNRGDWDGGSGKGYCFLVLLPVVDVPVGDAEEGH
jgi:hypothetical protein